MSSETNTQGSSTMSTLSLSIFPVCGPLKTDYLYPTHNDKI